MVTRAYGRLESEFETAIGRGAEKRSLPFYEYAHGRVLFNHEAMVEARGGDESREGEGDFIRNVYDALQESVDGRLIPALTFDKEGKAIIVIIIQP